MDSNSDTMRIWTQNQVSVRRPLVFNGSPPLDDLPLNYIRPPSERPRLSEVLSSQNIPLIDLKDLCGPTRLQVIKDIGRACEEDGFFQIVNHGVQDFVSRRMLEVATEFFTMPAEDRMQFYSDDPAQTVRLSTSFNARKEKLFNWRNYLRHHCYPLEDFVHAWPSKPAAYREVASRYCTEVRGLVLRLLPAISESLGLEPEYLTRALGNHGQHMAINYYPVCPSPELTYGLPAHSDPNALTVLLQDEVPGLQVLKNGHWIAVDSIANSFVVNVGDQIEVLSNGKYRSVIHRAVVNSSKSRISIPTFYCPCPDAVIGPAEQLIDNEYPAKYPSYCYKEYYQKFWSNELEGKSCLDSFTVDRQEMTDGFIGSLRRTVKIPRKLVYN